MRDEKCHSSLKIQKKAENIYMQQEESWGIASYLEVTASSSFVGDSPSRLFCFLEQLLTSFDVYHVTILFYISFLFSYILIFVS